MSLAFDKQGKPFTFARRAKKLLVRLFRNPGARGTCSQVLDADGQPLYVDIDSDYLELRRAVNHVPGLYRLDQCDDDGNELDDAPAAYVSIELPRNAASADGTVGDISPLVIIQQMAATQADVMKTMASQQAALIAATAEILRAPYRPAPPPSPTELRNAEAASGDRDDEDDDDDDDDEESVAPEHPVTAGLRMIEPYLPQFGAFLYEQFIKFMQGRKSASAATSIAVPSIPTSTVTTDAIETPNVAATANVAPAPVVAPPRVSTQAAPPAPEAALSAASSEARPTATEGSVPSTTVPTQEQLAHLFAIREQLTPKERAIAESAMARMDRATNAQWLVDLSAMSITEAVTLIRGMLAEILDAQPS